MRDLAGESCLILDAMMECGRATDVVVDYSRPWMEIDYFYRQNIIIDSFSSRNQILLGYENEGGTCQSTDRKSGLERVQFGSQT